MTTQTDIPRSDALIFFGATGDLAFKQIFPALQALVKHGRLALPIVAVGRKDVTIEKLRARVKESLAASEEGVDGGAFEKLASQLRYAAVDFDAPESFRSIRTAIPDAKHPLHYVALPPDVFEKVAANLAKVGLASGARLALEKPFGQDLASAKALSEALHFSFEEESLFRIDHFLGKEPVENLVYFRAANPLIERSLNSEQVDSVQITMAETFGVKGRAEFYDSVGAVRDVVQNHMLETIACLAMDLPTEPGHGGLRGARSRLLAHVRTLANGISFAARRAATRTKRGSPGTRRPRRSPSSASRLTHPAGRAFRSSSASESRSQSRLPRWSCAGRGGRRPCSKTAAPLRRIISASGSARTRRSPSAPT
jgi:glucose-6-phosphate 1-dehydrogenase